MMVEQNQTLRKATDAYLLQILEGIPSEEELAAQLSFSFAFRRKMRRLFRKVRKMDAAKAMDDSAGIRGPGVTKSRIPVIRRKRLLLVAIILSILISAMSVVAARETVRNFFIRIYETFTEIIFNRDVDQLPETTQTVSTASDPSLAMLPTWQPEGYEKIDQLETGGIYQIIYANQAGDELVFERHFSDTMSMLLDTEGVQVEEVHIGTITGFYYSKKNWQTLIWQEDTYILMIYGKISKEELLNMANSIDR